MVSFKSRGCCEKKNNRKGNVDLDIRSNYTKWLTAIEDTDLKNQLIAMTEREIDSAFYKDLEFDTNGLHGVMGAGTNRMNIYTVSRATQGLCDYLKNKKESPSVAIAFDNQIKSEQFARSAAGVIISSGADAYIFPKLMLSSILSYAITVLECDAIIVITASCNPAEYNGFRVYGSDGCHITRVMAELIEKCIQKVDLFDGVKKEPFAKDVQRGKIHFVSQDLLSKYSDKAVQYSINSKFLDDSDFKVVYSRINQAENKTVRETLSRDVLKNQKSVPEQENCGSHPVLKLPIGLDETPQADLLFAACIKCDNKIAVECKTAIQKKKDVSEMKNLICDIEVVKKGFDAASSRFDYQDDPDLVECCIYEMKALNAKYCYLLKEVRRLRTAKDTPKDIHASFLS
jgi:hypothetical protein